MIFPLYTRASPDRPGAGSGIAASGSGGCLGDTVTINLHHVVSIPKDGLRRFVGSVSPDVLEGVREALLFALGFDS